jgi:hypothetical protein
MWRKAFLRLGRRPVLTGLLLFAAGVTATALPVLRYGPVQPALHDEYAYLFLGETFVRGRLTNDPPPPPPEFFETFHHLITPRYIAKYPPGQGFALAAGILLGNPIIGVWLVNGFWAVALWWMLRGAAGPGWSFAGALAGVIGYGAMSYWGQSYWGGNVLALGGTLAFGGALRLWRGRGGWPAAAWAGVGCAIMAVTRPLEGCVFALGPAMIIWSAWWRPKWKNPRAADAMLFAFGAPTALGVALMLGYNVATTGSPWLFAHRLYESTHLPRMVLFVWEKSPPDPPNQPAYLAAYEHVFDTNLCADPLTFAQYWENLKKFSAAQFDFFFPLWTLPLAAAGLTGALLTRDRAGRCALGCLLLIILPLTTLRFFPFSHYAAAWAAPALLLIVQGARRLAAGWGRGAGRRLRVPAGAVLALLAVWPAMESVQELTRGFPQWMEFIWVYDRMMLQQKLEDRAQADGKQQLVVVTYPADHDPHAEWVFNSPDIATQTVVWVRSLGAERDAELFKWFPQREEWRVLLTGRGQLVRVEPIKNPAAVTPAPAQP